jgi:flagellar motor switch protein FliN/FliY
VCYNYELFENNNIERRDMADVTKFLDLFKEEVVSTIEALTGFEPQLSEPEILDFVDDSAKPPLALINVEVSGEVNGKIQLTIPAYLATALGDLMLAGEGDGKDDMDDEDLDGIKEITSNITGSFTTALGSQDDMPSISLRTEEASFIPGGDPVPITGMYKQAKFTFGLNGQDYDYMLFFDNNYEELFEKNPPAETPEEISESSMDIGGGGSASHPADMGGGSMNMGGGSSLFSNDEMRNISLLMNVELPVKVRIGKKEMLLRDVMTMDIGSVVELNQLANEALDVLVDNHVIARGEVIIIDGNFGVQITEIGSREERMKAFGG